MAPATSEFFDDVAGEFLNGMAATFSPIDKRLDQLAPAATGHRFEFGIAELQAAAAHSLRDVVDTDAVASLGSQCGGFLDAGCGREFLLELGIALERFDQGLDLFL